MFFGLVLIGIGGIFLLENMGVITGDVWKYIWPILIIILGLSILFKPWRRKSFGWGKWRSRQSDGKKEKDQ